MENYSYEEIEQHIEIINNNDPHKCNLCATSRNMLSEFLIHQEELTAIANRRREPTIIEYFIRHSYGRPLEYVFDNAQRQLIMNLTRQKPLTRSFVSCCATSPAEQSYSRKF